MGRTGRLGNQTLRLTSTSLPRRRRYHWQLSAWYLLLLKHLTDLTCTRTQACVSLYLSVFLTHLLSACVHINFSLPDTHNALLASIHTHSQTHVLTHTHTHILGRQNVKEESSRNWRGGFVVTVWFISSCQRAVICAWFMSHSVSIEDPLSNRPIVTVCWLTTYIVHILYM